ncbi:MAG: hypothetical protein M1816_003170 [Peltula sp. TS41687]|nr:MAG: hypothetical protein M1816_003170 [Peltula sp. TS41687]
MLLSPKANNNNSSSMKFYESSTSYDHPFRTVTLAYFLRYPNPYARHVLSTDVIDSYVDPTTRRLHTVRLHLKRSKIPPAILRLLPRGVLGGGGGAPASSQTDKNAAGQSYILERSVVDVKEGWMKTESRNLEWTGVLSVVERQVYTSAAATLATAAAAVVEGSGTSSDLARAEDRSSTDVKTTVTFHSRLGQGKVRKRTAGAQRSAGSSDHRQVEDDEEEEEEGPARKGLLASWSTASIQRSIELIGLRRTRDHLSKSTEGMKVVMERLRSGGLVGVLEAMKKDREMAFGREGRWRRAWRGSDSDPTAEDGGAHIEGYDE